MMGWYGGGMGPLAGLAMIALWVVMFALIVWAVGSGLRDPCPLLHRQDRHPSIDKDRWPQPRTDGRCRDGGQPIGKTRRLSQLGAGSPQGRGRTQRESR
jgi:hypothetical protein